MSARGQIIALTIENCVPAPDWLSQIVNAHSAAYPAIGGAVEIDPQAKLMDWAIYFSRYSNYMLPFRPRLLDDLAGDNCSYKRDALDRAKDQMRDGFWETFIHDDLRQRKEQLLCDPSIVVTYCGGLSGWSFFKRRYLHGKYFGARRGRALGKVQRLVRAAGAPIVPFLLLLRIDGRICKNGRHRSKLFPALPLIFCFAMAWSAGEALGYFSGSPDKGAPGGGLKAKPDE
jgi:hypothetical protein